MKCTPGKKHIWQRINLLGESLRDIYERRSKITRPDADLFAAFLPEICTV